MRRWLAILAALGSLVPLPARLFAAPRNVVLFITDDQGQDAGCYGNPVLKTPHLDQLASEGTRFEYAFCTTASCSPSRSVILSGLHNHANGQYGLQHAYHHFAGFPQVKSLPVRLAQAGYRTARIGKYHVAPEETYKFELALPGNGRSPVEMADRCREFIAASSEKPFFLLFATDDPHRGAGEATELPNRPNRFGNRPGGQSAPGVTEVKYDPRDVIVPPFLPDTPASRAELAQYYQAVSRIDQGLGRLIQLLKDAGKYDDTLILFLSDHGIPFPGAKTTVYEPGLRSPCIVRHPHAAKRGVVSQALISWVDLAPTILEFAQVEPPKPAELHGRSFLPILEDPNPTGWDEIFASHTFHEVTMYYPMRAIRTRRFKLIWNLAHGLPFPFASDLWDSATWQEALKGGPNSPYGKRTLAAYQHRPAFELYDLEQDPHEARNLADDPQSAGILAELKTKLKAFQQRTGDPWILKWDRE